MSRVLLLSQKIVSGGGGSANLSMSASGTGTATVDISTSKVDWALWGATESVTPSQTKSGGGSTISAAIYINGPVYGYNDDQRTLTFAGGTPTASGSHTSGIYNAYNDTVGNNSTGQGLAVTLPATTTTRVARIYFGTYSGTIGYTASLSDSSATPLAASSIITAGTGGVTNGWMEFTYASAAASQTLLVRLIIEGSTGGYGNVSLNGANYS